MKQIWGKLAGNRVALAVEILLTLCIILASIPMGLNGLTRQAAQFAGEVEADYNLLVDGYVTVFEMMTGQIQEKLEEEPTFEELQAWLQEKEADFREQIGPEVYDGIALTYQGGYAHSWDYGDYAGYDPTTRPWYQQAQAANGKVVIVAPYVTYLDSSYFDDIDDDYILMTIAQKYNDEISFDYDIKITDIRAMLIRHRAPYEEAKILLYDAEGYVLSSSDSSLYAHNITNQDDVISADLADGLVQSASRQGRLVFSVVDGEWRMLYSSSDENGNTLCILYPFWQVLMDGSLLATVVALMLILLELFMYRYNRRQALEAHRRDLRLTRILDASYEEQVFVDVNAMIFYGNTRAEQIARGTEYASLYTRLRAWMKDRDSRHRLDEFISPDALRAAKDVPDGDSFTSQRFRVVREFGSDQEPLIYEISRMITRIDGKIIAGILANDVTEDASILRSALRRAEQASRAKGQFLARMSHEIRTPMNAIIGETTIAQKHLPAEEKKVHECLDKVMISSRHLLNLINDILDMSAIESNKIKIAAARFDLKDVMNTVATLYYSQCCAKGITFETKLEHMSYEFLVGDQLRLQQIILNLLSNALKFTEAGGTITFGMREEVQGDSLQLHIFVKDTGCGISKEYMERIFKPFEQENALTAKEHGGSGLGLSISKNLVELMGGTIAVDSTAGQGTTFTICLPFLIAAEQYSIPQMPLGNMQALVIDDDADALKYAGDILRHIGIGFDCAKSGAEALNLITKARNDKRMYQICMVDWKMKGMSGLELTRRIRMACGEEPIVIVASGYDLNEIRDEAEQAGVDSCIAKPLFQSTVFDLLMNLSQGKLVRGTADAADYDFAGCRLLLVDDNELNREIAAELLMMVGFAVETACDGRECCEKFQKSAPGTYAAILMDVQMPVMNGYEAARAIRKSGHPQAEEICIIAMTANAFVEDIAASMEAGMNDHVSKPIDTELLYQLLGRHLNRGRSE